MAGKVPCWERLVNNANAQGKSAAYFFHAQVRKKFPSGAASKGLVNKGTAGQAGYIETVLLFYRGDPHAVFRFLTDKVKLPSKSRSPLLICRGDKTC
jgi:hypothetical protein